MRNYTNSPDAPVPIARKYCAELRRAGGLKNPYATASDCCGFGGSGGIGQPSATSVPPFKAGDFGGRGGIGQPSATSVLLFVAGDFGGSGGIGQPSAYCLCSVVTGLPAERLTERTIGVTIKTARTKTATAIAVFFKGVSLLSSRMKGDSFCGVPCLKMFRMRNTEPYENADTASAKPQGC